MIATPVSVKKEEKKEIKCWKIRLIKKKKKAWLIKIIDWEKEKKRKIKKKIKKKKNQEKNVYLSRKQENKTNKQLIKLQKQTIVPEYKGKPTNKKMHTI